ncbi:hypothetical protein AJ80_06232 [Polytolypa hystricis UAMH7299]|uniref:F-box domain-containing protein n=1 Tax=Polytolypa hystricis (strain UAMH7299) TaxID=1447883 RepID=A0A2B7XZ28_POLH7|nr:hypothetical protein AJ80_06232 [Polytolypa hystricis UAMH7299]
MDAVADPDGHSISAILTSFRALAAPKRRQAYRALIAELRHNECHEIIALVFAKLHFDILVHLPLELVAQVCVHLEPWDVYASRRVCKSWNILLSSPVVCSAIWPRCYANEHLDVSVPGWQQLLKKRAKQRLALVSGRPYSMATYLPGDVVDLGNPLKSSYAEGCMAWCHGYYIELYSLVKGHHRTFMTENRDNVEWIRLSRSALAACTARGYCHVWSLDSGEEGCFRLPSANYLLGGGYYTSFFVIAEDTVAIRLHLKPEITVWDLQSKVTKKIEMGFVLPIHVFLCTGNKSLIILHAETSDGTLIQFPNEPFTSFVAIRYDIGSPIPYIADRQRFELHDGPMVLHRGYMDATFAHLAADLNMTKTVAFRLLKKSVEQPTLDYYWDTAESEDGTDCRYQAFVSYDQSANKVKIQFGQDSYGFGTPKFSQISGSNSILPGNVMYRVSLDSLSISVYDLAKGPLEQCSEIVFIVKESAAYITPDRGIVSTFDWNMYIYGLRSFGDGVWFGMVARSGAIVAWCFDEDVTMEEEVPGYRQVRALCAQQRAERRKSKQHL